MLGDVGDRRHRQGGGKILKLCLFLSVVNLIYYKIREHILGKANKEEKNDITNMAYLEGINMSLGYLTDNKNISLF